jgi:hypothetical protein
VDTLRIQALSWIFSFLLGYGIVALALYCTIDHSRGMALLPGHSQVGATTFACWFSGQQKSRVISIYSCNENNALL